jgi:hypothetical protein
MKKNLQLIILIALLFATPFAKAQTSGGPDAFGYVWRSSLDTAGPVYNWIDITNLPGTVTVQGLQDDNIKGPFSLAVPFTYYWYGPNKFWIGSNGYLGFTSSAVAAPFPFIPNLAPINDWMAAMASDLTLTDINIDTIPGTHCMYWQNNDTLIVTWENVPFWDQNSPGYTGSNTFQIILNALDSSITYQYKAQIGTYLANPTDFMEVGIENNSGGIGLEVNHDTYPLPGTAIRFYYPDTVTLAINDASTFYVGNPGSKGVILSRNVSSFTSIAQVKNTGNQFLSTFDSYSRVVNASSLIQVRDTVNVTNLVPGQTRLVTYPDTWTPTINGVYRQINTTILPGDATPSNNVDTLELWVVDPTVASISFQWDNGVASGPGISWLGGGAGIAQHYVPPFYPCNINAIGALVTSDLNSVGFSLQVYADDGPGGSPLTQLDSIFVLPGTFTPGVYYQTSTTTTLTINSGGFYVAWMMGGESIVLGEDANTPHSRQSYEILGPASTPANWSEYRNGALVDPIIRALVSNPTGINDVVSESNKIGEFYPNPAQSKTSLSYNLKERSELKFSLYNLQGNLIAEKNLGNVNPGEGTIQLNLSNYAAGSYICKITAGSHEYHKKITVVK